MQTLVQIPTIYIPSIMIILIILFILYNSNGRIIACRWKNVTNLEKPIIFFPPSRFMMSYKSTIKSKDFDSWLTIIMIENTWSLCKSTLTLILCYYTEYDCHINNYFYYFDLKGTPHFNICISTFALNLVLTLLNNEFALKILNSFPFSRKKFRTKKHKNQ